jgi:hypothetical protein
MNLPHNVAELQREKIAMELEGLDRIYLNACLPQLTSAAGVAAFVRYHLGYRFASTKQVAEMTERFVKSIGEFADQGHIEMLHFKKGQRKDTVMQERLAQFSKKEGVVFIGVAQEKAKVPRTERRQFGEGKGSIPWISYSTAMVNFYYFYCVDEDFGPFFLKFCSYFPYTAKLCINGHEYLKRQLSKEAIPFEDLDNGIASCADVGRAQQICDQLDAAKIERFFRKWLGCLPHPFSTADRKAGYRYQLSILQAEFSLTQIWEKAVHGRCFFEEVIRENIDLGRPEQVPLIFERKIPKKTVDGGRFRTRIITEGVIPSLHVYYKNTHLKQYHKQVGARHGLRTETTINNTYDFGVGRLVRNLPQLRKIGFAANRRLLEVETLNHDCQIGAAAFAALQQPTDVDGQHGSALRFGDVRVQAMLAVLLMMSLKIEGFRNRQLRPLLAQYIGVNECDITPGRMSYDLRRLRLHKLIERIEGTHRYQLTQTGLRTALLYSRVYARVLRPGLSILHDPRTVDNHRIARQMRRLEKEINDYIIEQIAA